MVESIIRGIFIYDGKHTLPPAKCEKEVDSTIPDTPAESAQPQPQPIGRGIEE
ncbi:MAG: hypothetical protein QXI42_04330 [Thermoproteota archaeon]|nr:hypothetical protein [Candidatus Brockarchaeota archaeon]